MRYELSAAADHDLEDIFGYSEREFGIEQALAYLQRIDRQLDALTDNPTLGRARHEIKHDLRSLVIAQHVIFYRLLPDRLRVVRILNGRQDIPRLGDN